MHIPRPDRASSGQSGHRPQGGGFENRREP